MIARLPTSMRARQLLGTADELLDLSDDVDPVATTSAARSRRR